MHCRAAIARPLTPPHHRPALPSKKRPPSPPGSAPESATQVLVDAGLQHAILMRAIPVLRHDVAGPLSVMRMGTMLLKRRLAKGDMTPEQAVERVEQIEEQLGEIAHHIRRLRLWDLQINDRHTVRALVTEAIELARPALMVRGTELEPLPADIPGWDDETLVPHTLLYVVLGAIYQLAEHASPLPAQITVAPAGPLSVRVQARGTSTATQLLDDSRSQGGMAQPPAMDLAALLQLAQPLGVTVQASGTEVTVTLPGG